MRGRLDGLRDLSPAELLLLVQAAGGLLLARALLATAGFARTRAALAWLARLPLLPSLSGSVRETSTATARLVYAAGARFPLRATCLQKALVLHALLRRQHVAAELRIGVRVVGGRLEGHAWVEQACVPLGQDPAVATGFAPFPGDLAEIRTWNE
jgi:hypothetical protein